MKYRLVCISEYREVYEIEANSMEEAEDKYFSGEVEPTSSEDLNNEIIEQQEIV